MAQLTDQTLAQSLEKSLARLYVVAGDDAFVVDGAIAQIAEAAGAPLERFDAQTAPREELQQVFFNVSLFGAARRAVLLDNLFSKPLAAADFDFYKSAFEGLDDSLVVIARYVDEEGRYFSVPKQAGELAAAANGYVVKATAKHGADAAAAIQRMAAEQGASIDRAAAARLAALCADDLMLASNEIKKLAALADYNEITKDHVESLAVRSAEAGVYDMLGRLERGDRAGALALLHEMLESKTEPIIISSVLYTAFVNIYRAKLAQQAGFSEQRLFSDFNYRKGDKKVGVAFRQAKTHSVEQLEQVISLLAQLDLDLKSSPVDRPTLLELCVANVMDLLQ